MSLAASDSIKSSTIVQSITESLRKLPAGHSLSVHVIQTSDHHVESLTPWRRFSHFHSETTMSRRILAFVSQGSVLVAGLEVHEFTSISVQASGAHQPQLSPSVAVDVCIEKIDTSGFLSARMPLAKMLVAGYLRSLQRYHAAVAVPTVGVHLFARAQPEYLFAKSLKNPDKHILDDLGLVKWWQSALNYGLQYAICAENNTNGCAAEVAANCVVPGSTASEAPWFLGSNQHTSNNATNADGTIGQYTEPKLAVADAATTAATASDHASIPASIRWTWGLPYVSSARAHDCVLQFPDDPMTRLLSEPYSSSWSVSMLLEMLAVSEECGSGRRTAYYSAALPVGHLQDPSSSSSSSSSSGSSAKGDNTAEQGSLSFDDYDKALIALFDREMDFSTHEAALVSSKRFLDLISASFGIPAITIDTMGKPIVKSASEPKQQEPPKVNDLTMAIRKKRKAAN
ncbi:hypothetical protein LPJ64_002433 [Coemansia asiatica]|uniref:histone acetyltransferase n=1 Tax=Coemansia asiatica TaxID=1052880 RepID=A0A9W8CKJ7_9FUNG|nr:hypothetical protein LPJ64_002433 [Coemansia asiatica]